MAHWSERPEFAARVRGIFDSIAPKTWEVYVWTKAGGGGAIPGRLDTSDAHNLIARVLEETVYDDD